MLLAIDVGNTNMEFGVYDGDRLLGSFRMMTKNNATSDEIGLLACQYFERFGIDRTAIEAVMVASVVPQVMYTLSAAMAKYLGLTPIVVDVDIPSGLSYGPLVTDERLRFDFTHFSALTADELKAVERTVNAEIFKGLPVTMTEMPIEEAKKLGAMALFGEKYGDVVRVVRAGDLSIEFCGGTHMDNTAKLGLFKICSESSVAAGVRRIEAVTGTGVSAMLDHALAQLDEAAAALKAGNAAELTHRAAQVMAELKAKEKENESLKQKLAAAHMDELMAGAKQVGAVRVLTAQLDGAGADEVRSMCDQVRDRADDIVAVIVGTAGGKAVIASSVGKRAQAAGAHAGNIVRETAKLAGGNGGGRPDSATAGAKDLSRIPAALTQVESIVAAMLK